MMKKLFLIPTIVLMGFVQVPTNAQNTADKQLDVLQNKSVDEMESWQKGYVIFKNSKDTVYGYLDVKLLDYYEIVKVKFRRDKDVKKGTIMVNLLITMFSAGVGPGSDTIRFLGFGGKNYKWMNYTDTASAIKKKEQATQTGWAEILEQGSRIRLSKGVCNVHYSSSPAGIAGAGLSVMSGGMPAMGGGAPVRNCKPCMGLRKQDGSSILLKDDNRIICFNIDKENRLKCTNEKFLSDTLNYTNGNRLLSFLGDDKALVEKWGYRYLTYRDILLLVKDYNDPKNK